MSLFVFPALHSHRRICKWLLLGLLCTFFFIMAGFVYKPVRTVKHHWLIQQTKEKPPWGLLHSVAHVTSKQVVRALRNFVLYFATPWAYLFVCLFGYDPHKSSWKYENLEATRGTILEAFRSWSRRTSKSCRTASQGTRLETHQIKFNGFHLIGFNINEICSADRTDCILRKQQGVKSPHIPCA